MERRAVKGIFVLLFIFIGSFFVANSSASVVPSTTPEGVREAFKSVVIVHVTVTWRGGLELEGRGSGSFVVDDYILTVPHIASEFHQVVMDPRTRIEVEVEGKIYRTKIVAVDWRKELMLLKAEGAFRVPPVKLASGVVKNETVFITGYIYEPTEVKRESYISAPALVKSIDDKRTVKKNTIVDRAMKKYGVLKILAIYGKAINGISGGPVFNTKGELVGVTWLRVEDDYAFATPVDVVREFLEEHLKDFEDEQ